MTFGKRLQKLRQYAGLSQEQLAEALHVSRAAIAKWENDYGLPDIGNIQAISDYFGISIDILLDATQPLDYVTISVPIFITRYGADACGREVYHAVLLEKFPDAYSIFPVSLDSHFNRSERIINVLTFGLYKCIWQATHWKAYTGIYYLADTMNGQFLLEFEGNTMKTTRLEYETRTIPGVIYVGKRRFLKQGPDLVKNQAIE